MRLLVLHTHGGSLSGGAVSSQDPFRQVVGQLDLVAAAVAASRPNDLLPRRPEDNIGGEVGKRFSEALRRLLAEGRYTPQEVSLVMVAKPDQTTRLAALMTLEDRTVYEALVERMRNRVEQNLLGSDFVMWPRGLEAQPQWMRFESTPLEGAHSHILISDIANYYESIPHHLLGDVLVNATGLGPEVEALMILLTQIMGRPRGLPQGLATSDVLATAYLSPVDRAMLGAGFMYYRHGDDIRIPVESYSEGRRAVALLESELRKLWLAPNPSKSRILMVSTYSKQQKEVEQARNEFEEHVQELLVEELLEDDSEQLRSLFENAGLDEEILWGFFYHQTVEVEDVAELIRPHIKPDKVAVAAEMFRDTVKRAPIGGLNKLRRETFHGRLTLSLTILTSFKSDAALPHVRKLLIKFPDETKPIADYLSSMCSGKPARVVQAVEKVVEESDFLLAWQRAWFLRILQCAHSEVSDEILEWAGQVARDEGDHWVARVEAAKLVAARTALEEGLFRRMWELCPRVYRSDLVEAAHAMAAQEPWAARFLEAVNDNRIVWVVLSHLEERRAGSNPSSVDV
jgi:hypothetical protein